MADTDPGDYHTDRDLQTNGIVAGAAPSVPAWLLRAALLMAPVPGFRLYLLPAVPTPAVPSWICSHPCFLG